MNEKYINEIINTSTNDRTFISDVNYQNKRNENEENGDKNQNILSLIQNLQGEPNRQYFTNLLQKILEVDEFRDIKNLEHLWIFFIKIVDTISANPTRVIPLLQSRNDVINFFNCSCGISSQSQETSSLDDEDAYCTVDSAAAPAPPPLPPNIPPSVPAPPPLTFAAHKQSQKLNDARIPSCKMRKLQWDKLNSCPQQQQQQLQQGATIWTFNKTDLVSENNFRELEEFFNASGVRQKQVCNKEKKKLEEISLIDSKRSLSVNIFLKQLKLTSAEIVSCLRSGQGPLIAPDKLKGLHKILPESEELDLIRSFTGDVSKLAGAEKFYLEMSSLSGYKSCVECLLIKEEFNYMNSSIKSIIDTFIMAANDVLRNQALKDIFQIILITGNFLNFGGFTGDATGFRLSSLLKLRDTKSNKEGFTLLHYVAMILKRNKPQIVDSIKELNRVLEASKYSMNTLLEDSAMLSEKLQIIENHKFALERDLANNMQTFLESTNESMKLIERDTKKLETMRKKVCQYLADDEATFRLDDCFKTISIFVEKFFIVFKENDSIMKTKTEFNSIGHESTKNDTRRFSICPMLNDSKKAAESEASFRYAKCDSTTNNRHRNVSSKEEGYNNDLVKYLLDQSNNNDKSNYSSVRHRRRPKTPVNIERERPSFLRLDGSSSNRPLSANLDKTRENLWKKTEYFQDDVFTGLHSAYKFNLDMTPGATLTEKALYNHSAQKWKLDVSSNFSENNDTLQDSSISSTVDDELNKSARDITSIKTESTLKKYQKPVMEVANFKNEDTSVNKEVTEFNNKSISVKYRKDYIDHSKSNAIVDEGFVSQRSSVDRQLIYSAKNLKLPSLIDNSTESMHFANSVDSLIPKKEKSTDCDSALIQLLCVHG